MGILERLVSYRDELPLERTLLQGFPHEFCPREGFVSEFWALTEAAIDARVALGLPSLSLDVVVVVVVRSRAQYSPAGPSFSPAGPCFLTTRPALSCIAASSSGLEQTPALSFLSTPVAASSCIYHLSLPCSTRRSSPSR